MVSFREDEFNKEIIFESQCSIPKLFHNPKPNSCEKTNEQENQMDNRQLEKGTPVKEIAAVMRVTPRRIYQLKK